MKAAVRDLVVGAEDNKAEPQSCKHTLSVPPRARPPGPGGGLEGGAVSRRRGRRQLERGAPPGADWEEGAGAGAAWARL